MSKQTWQEKCLDVLKQAEYDEELMDGFIWLSRKAIKENKSLYDVMREILINYKQKHSS